MTDNEKLMYEIDQFNYRHTEELWNLIEPKCTKKINEQPEEVEW